MGVYHTGISVATKVWAAAAVGNASTDANWDGGVKPVAGDDIDFHQGGNCTWDLAITTGAFSIGAGYAAVVTQGAVDFGCTDFTIAAGTLTGGTPKTLSCSGSFTKTGGTITGSKLRLTFTGAGGVYTSNTLVVLKAATFTNDTSVNSDVEIQVLTVSSSKTVTVAAGKTLAVRIYSSGEYTNNGIITGAGTLKFLLANENESEAIGTVSCNTVIDLDVGATASCTFALLADATIGADLSLVNNHAVQTLTLSIDGYDLSVASLTASVRSILTTTTGIITYSGSWDTSAARFTCGTGKVIVTGAAATMKLSVPTYYDPLCRLQVSTGATLTMLSDLYLMTAPQSDGTINYGAYSLVYDVSGIPVNTVATLGSNSVERVANVEETSNTTSMQRMCFAADRFWLFYIDQSATAVAKTYYTSSANGYDWTAPTLLYTGTTAENQDISILCSGTTLYYAYEVSDNTIRFRKGSLGNDGIITWAAAEQSPALEGVGTVVYNPTLAWDGTNVYVGYGLKDGANYYGCCDKNANNDGTYATAGAGYPYHTAALTAPRDAVVCSAAAGKVVMAVVGHDTSLTLYWDNAGAWSSIYASSHNSHYPTNGGLAMVPCWTDGSVHLVAFFCQDRVCRYMNVSSAGVVSSTIDILTSANPTGKSMVAIALDERAAPAYDVHVFHALLPFTITASGGIVTSTSKPSGVASNDWSEPGLYHTFKAGTDTSFPRSTLVDTGTATTLVYTLCCSNEGRGTIGVAYQETPVTPANISAVQRFQARMLNRIRTYPSLAQDLVAPCRRRR